MYLFEHEVLVFALGCGHRAIGDGRGRLLDGRAVDARVAHLIPCYRSHLADGQVGYITHMRKQRGDVAGKQHFLFAVPDDYAARVAELERDYLVRLLPAHHHDRICAFHSSCHGAHRIFKRAAFAHVRFDEIRNALGVRLRIELVSFGYEFLLQFQVVLEYAVVHDQNIAGAIGVRVSVEVGRPAVRRPARMPDAAVAVRQAIPQFAAELGQLARRLVQLRHTGFVQHRDPRAVVATILERAKPLQNYRSRRSFSYVANDSTHIIHPCCGAPSVALSPYTPRISFGSCIATRRIIISDIDSSSSLLGLPSIGGMENT